MLHLPAWLMPDRKSGTFGATGRTLMQTVLCIAVRLPQSSVTIQLLDEQMWQRYYTTERFYVLFFVANKPTAHWAPRHQCMMDPVTILRVTSSHLQPRILSIVSAGNQMIIMMMRCPNTICFLVTTTVVQMFKRKLQMRMFRQQQYLAVIWNSTLGHFTD